MRSGNTQNTLIINRSANYKIVAIRRHSLLFIYVIPPLAFSTITGKCRSQSGQITNKQKDSRKIIAQIYYNYYFTYFFN